MIAPPTIAMQMIPEPSAARGPNPSQASEKMVGNMMELNNPMASSDHPATAPSVLAEINNSAITTAASHARILPGEKMRSR
jgi:hypothetical protein